MERNDETIGVLVVHGIGAQGRGETLAKLLNGLRRVLGDSLPDEIPPGEPVSIAGQPVRFYEVYWADLLMDDKSLGAFQMKELQSIAWFPWLNHRRGAYPRGSYSPLKLFWWWVALPIANFLVLFAYYGAAFFAELVWGAENRRIERNADSGTMAVIRKVAGRSSKRTKVDGFLDEYLGDVFSYVNSAGGAFYRDEGEAEVPAEVEQVYGRIMQRFYSRLVAAQRDGCTEIQIVAHSLGTVVTFHALSGLGFDAEGEDAEAIRAASARVRRVYTIGSPLEKIRFFWPRLVPAGAPLAGAKFDWDNFVSWFDPVAGTLKSFGAWGRVTNHRLLGGGFFRGHVVYERSAVFLAAFMEGVCGHSVALERSSKEKRRDVFLLLVETLAAPAVLVVMLLAGAALFAMTAYVTPWLLSWVVRWFLPEETWRPLVRYVGWFFVGSMFLAFLLAPKIRAARVHSTYWAADR